ncbi:MAG: hypothetical protein CVV44_08295 [Spirochaetae bacterium HGW-Spirochaetae-1]|jgi:phosphoserine phosphatase|nr:MAG: hypothetical protein CVV44_08295 [Spirochaetae bacterium HGW-Spirochaetae-1]
MPHSNTPSKRVCALFLTIALFPSLPGCKDKKENHADAITRHIIATRNDIRTILPAAGKIKPLFITFWDFDGTIQKGDCTEGLTINGNQVFKGLAQKSIEAGFSREYPPAKYSIFKKTALHLEKADHTAYLLLYPRALAGNEENKIIAFSEDYFNSTLQKYFFQSSMTVMKSLQQEDIGIYVISASAQVFVQGSASALDIPSGNIRGILMKSDQEKITREAIPPITHGPGKTMVLKQIVADLKKEKGGPVFVLAGFGNSYGTDGDFLAYITKIKLPAGKTMAVMINGGEAPGKYRGMFYEVKQEKIMK